MKDNSSSSGGIGFCGLLTIVFIILKLCGVIAWSWWWVLSPLWINVIVAVICVVIYVAVYFHHDKGGSRGSNKGKF